MKEITVNDCIELRNKFEKYCDTAEQHEFSILAMINIRMDNTINEIINVGKVENQKDIRAMFRVVLKTIGEDFSDYLES